MIKPKVKLIAATKNPERIIALAARSTHTRKFPEHISNIDTKATLRYIKDPTGIYTKEQKLIQDYLSPEEREHGKLIGDNEATKLTNKIQALGHLSVLEHASYTFMIEGISRSCSHQIVRHRIASYSQQSQRYVTIREGKFVIPKTINDNKVAKKLYDEFHENVNDLYENLIDFGIPAEDARYILPNSTTTHMVMTMNARNLISFFELRTCLKAQWEIRKVANLMLKEVKKVSPMIFENVGPQCKKLGYCPEGDKECKMNPERMRKK